MSALRCDWCGRKSVRLRADDTYPVHHYQRGGVKVRCEKSETRYNRHTASIRAGRSSNVWVCECRCGESFRGSTYEAAERAWDDHMKRVGVPA